MSSSELLLSRETLEKLWRILVGGYPECKAKNFFLPQRREAEGAGSLWSSKEEVKKDL